MDNSKAHVADVRHRVIFHSSYGCFIVEMIFGTNIENSDGKLVSVRDIAEQHILEDLGTIPSLDRWLTNMPIEAWMGGKTLKKIKLREQDESKEEAEDPDPKNERRDERDSIIEELRKKIAEAEEEKVPNFPLPNPVPKQPWIYPYPQPWESPTVPSWPQDIIVKD